MFERSLSKESIKVLHKWVMKNDPNAERGVLNEGLIQGSMDRAMGDFYGEKQFEGIFEKAAVLMHSIVTFHPFVDGNKRTALLSTFWFLSLHGYGLYIFREEIIQILLDIAEGKIEDIRTIAEWLEKHSERTPYGSRIILFFLRVFNREIDISPLEEIGFYSQVMERILDNMEEGWPG